MAQGNFHACLIVTLKYEGGKADNPADPGGRTNEGVTQATYDAYRRSKGLATRDVYVISDDEVEDIYQSRYFEASGSDKLPTGLDLCHFDGTVNSGLGNSSKWLVTSGTVATASSIHAYSAARLTSLHSFRAWATFGKGWAARVAGVEAKAIVMMSAMPAVAKATIAKAGTQAADKAKTASAIAHVATAATGASVVVATSHPTFGMLAGLLSFASAIYAAFHASTSGARAAVLSSASAAL